MKSARSEIASLLTVLAVPVCMLAVYPYGALSFKGAPSLGQRASRSSQSSIAFVTLSAAEEAEALRIAKSSLRGDIGGTRRLHIDLAFGELPADEIVPVLPIEDRTRPVGLGRVAHEFSSYLPSQAAEATGSLPVAESKPIDELAFSREEMLKLN